MSQLEAEIVPANESLWYLEMQIQALIDTESLVSPEDREQFERELSLALKNSVAKRDACAQVLTSLLIRADAAKAEREAHVKRLEAREKRLRAEAEALSGYILACIRENVPEGKKARRLEGERYTLIAKKTPAAVEITNADTIPAPLCRYTLPSLNLENLMELPVRFQQIATREPSKTLLRESLEQPCEACSGNGWVQTKLPNGDPRVEGCFACHGSGKKQVAGARLVTDRLRLVIE